MMIDVNDILYDVNGNKYINWEKEKATLVDSLVLVFEIFGFDFENFTLETLETKLLSAIIVFLHK